MATLNQKFPYFFYLIKWFRKDSGPILPIQLYQCYLLYQFFLVVQILILAVQIILHFPKKNLDVQKKFGRPKNFFSSFFHMKLMFLDDQNFFWTSKFFLGPPNFFGQPNFFWTVKIEIWTAKIKIGKADGIGISTKSKKSLCTHIP